MAFTSQRTKIELLHPIDGSVLVDITTKGRSANVSRRPTYANRGYHRNAAVTAARLRTQGTVTLQLNVDDLGLLHELERWQKGVVWYPMRADLRGRRYRQPDLRITFMDGQGAAVETVRAYGVKLSDESLDLGMGPAKESISLDVLGGFEPKEGGFEPVRGLDFHRTGPATYVALDGTLTTAGDGVARFGVPWVVRRNLLRNSQDFTQSTWTKDSVTVSASQAKAPDETYTASLLTKTDSASYRYAREFSVAVTSASSYTLSCYVKKNTGSRPGVTAFRAGSIDFVAAVNVNTGASVIIFDNYGSITAHSAESVGDGWYRLKVTFNTGAATTIDAGPAADGAESLASNYFWGCQLNPGTVALPLQPTNATGVDFTHPLNGAGVVLEGAGANLYPAPTDGASIPSGSFYTWSGTPLTPSIDASTTYQGKSTLKFTGAAAGHSGYFYNGVTYTSGKPYTFWVLARTLTAGAQVGFYLGGPGYVYKTIPADGNWHLIQHTFTPSVTGAAETHLFAVVLPAGGGTAWLSHGKIDDGPFVTSWHEGTRAADLCGIVPPHNELLHSRDLTQPAWTRTAGASVTKSGTANTLTLAATTDAITQAVTPPDVPGTTRTIAAKLRLGTLSGSVRLRLLDQAGAQIASTTISTSDLHATDARTFTVTGTPGAGVTGLRIQLIGNAGTGTVIVESLRLVRGSHPGMEVQTADTPIPAPASPALDPAWSQNGRIRFRVLPLPGSNVSGKAYAIIGYGQGGSPFVLWRSAGTSGDGLTFERAHNGPTGTSGQPGRSFQGLSATGVYDGAPHEIVLEWTNEFNEETGAREMWQRWYIGELKAVRDVAALYGATAWAEIDPSRLISGGNCLSVLSQISLDRPTPRAGYRQV